MFKVNNEKHQSYISWYLLMTTGIFIVNFESIFRFALVFLLVFMTLNM